MFQTNLFDLFNLTVKEVKKEKRSKSEKPTDKNYEQMDLFSCFNVLSVEKKEEKKSTVTDIVKTAIEKTVDKVVSLFKNDHETIDFKLTKRNFKEEGSLKEKFNRNINAIKLLKKIESENRLATKDEQTILAQYVGWGGLAKAFDSKDGSWAKEYNELKSTLTEEEYASARRSTNTAFYTPIPIIRFIYNVLIRLGFEGGKILDPSMGIGYFEGVMPDNIRENSKIEGIELDNLSSRIAKQLYQNIKITNSGYESTILKDNSYDLIISNIPFGDFTIYDEVDKDLNELNLFIHDYYFIKSLRKVREGGIIAFITSAGTMDKKDTKLRALLKDNVRFLGSVRLPYIAFKQLANTEVTTDIIFLQKISENVDDTAWLDVREIDNNITINEYYINNPHMMLGKMKLKSSQFGFAQICEADKELDLEKALDKMVKYFPADVYFPLDNDYYMYDDDELLDSSMFPNLKDGGYEVFEGKIYQKQGDKLLPTDFKGKSYQMIVKLVELKNHVLLMIDEQIKGCSDDRLVELQKQLNTLYTNFTFSYGVLNSKEVKKVFEDDPDYYLLCSLEVKNKDGYYEKGAFFTERTISSEKHITHVETVEDALIVSLNIRGTIDLEYIAALCSDTVENAKNTLLKKGLIFINPLTEKYELREEYLSGNVRKKLKIAKEKVSENPIYQLNVDALENVVPEYVYDVYFQLGSTWIPEDVIKSFVVELLDISNTEELTVTYNSYLSLWKVKKSKRLYINSSKMLVEYGTSRKSALHIINDTLNMKDVEVYDTIEEDGKEKRVLNPKETQFARQKQDLIKSEFTNFIERHENIKKALIELYNDTFNAIVNRKFDGSFLTFPGKNPNITLRPHQQNAVARILFDKNNTLLAHSVGTGKTWTMQAAGMELVRLGLAKKVLYVVPNSLVKSGQFANEFLKLYPAARLLVATDKDFSKKNRRRLINKIATNNYDGIIMAHSSFKLIPVSAKTQQEFYNKQISEINNVIDLLDQEEDRFMIKRLEKRRQSLINKAKKLMDIKRDDTINFERLGIDFLFVDEAHRFKNLYVYSANLAGISGVPTQVSDKAVDMYMKASFLNEQHSNKAVCFATGTPISNSMAELYTNMRYLIQNILDSQGLYTFDAWASTFGQVVSALEVTPTGKGFRSNKRFAKFNNVPELMSIFKECADIITSDMVDLQLPSLRGGKPIIEEIKPTEEMKAYVDSLVARAEAIYNGSVKPWEDNMLSVTNDGRMMAVDPRLVGIETHSIMDTPKLARVCENIYTEWMNGRVQKLTQLVFCDLGTPTGKGFNFYEAIRSRLVDMGIPKEQIKFIHEGNTDEKRAKLLEDVRDGVVRILIGSTDKMGEGMNVQNRLVAIHEVDCPWRPSDVEQREGRLVRQGNMNKEVAIYRYVVKSSFDAYSWQTIERKSSYIEQIMTGKSDVRSVEDITDKTLSYQETKAIACDNPIVLRKFEVDSEVQKLQLLQRAYKEQRSRLLFKIEDIKYEIKNTEEYIKAAKIDLQTAKTNSNKDSEFEIKVGEKIFTERVKAGEAILEMLKLFNNIGEEEEHTIGMYKGFELIYQKIHYLDGWNRYLALKGELLYKVELSASAIGNITKLENIIDGFEKKIINKEQNLARLKAELISFESQTKLPFTEEKRLKELLIEQSKIDAELAVHQGVIGAGVEVEEDLTEILDEETA